MSHRNRRSRCVSTFSTATGTSIFSNNTLLTNGTSTDSLASHRVSVNKRLSALVNPPLTISEVASVSSPRPSLAITEPTPIHTTISQNLTVVSSKPSSHHSTAPEITTTTTPSPIAPAAIGIRAAISRFTAATDIKASISRYTSPAAIKTSVSRYTSTRHLRKTQKAAVKATRKTQKTAAKAARKAEKTAAKAARKAENRARSRAYFADFYADDALGAWHDAPASGCCSCWCCNDGDGSKVKDPVFVGEIVGMEQQQQQQQQQQPQTRAAGGMGVTRMVGGRAVIINF